MKFIRSALAVAALLAVSILPAKAQDYPTKPVTIVVPYTPGGGTDILARVLAAHMGKMWGQNFLVVNKVGAFGILAMQELIKNPADGYVLMVGNVSTNGITPVLYKDKMKFDYTKDIMPLAHLADLPSLLLAATVNFHYTNLKDILDYARANPNKLRYASPGLGTYPQFDTELMAERAGGLKLVHVPLKGGASDILNSVATGDTQIGFVNMATAEGMTKAGKLYPIAIAYDTRLPNFPNVPTMAESGFPGVGTVQWLAAYAKAGTPRPIVDKLFAAITQIMSDPDVVKSLSATGMIINVSKSPEDAAKWQQSELDKWTKMNQEVHISLE